MLQQILASGFVTGCFYAIIGIGFVITYRANKTFNLAQGHMAVGTAFLCQWLWGDLHLPIGLSILVAILTAGAVGAIIEFAAVRPVVNRGAGAWFMTTIALSYILQYILSTRSNFQTLTLPNYLPGHTVSFLGVRLTVQQIAIAVAAVVLLMGMDIGARRTSVGRIWRAVAADQEVATYMGIRAGTIIVGAYALSGFFVAMGGILFSPVTGFSATTGFTLTINGFTAVLVGGIDSIRGCLLAGVLLGVVEGFASYWGGSLVQDISPLIVLAGCLLLRPSGIFGSKALLKV